MDNFYNQKKDYSYHEQPTYATGQTMASASIFMGIASVFLAWSVYPPMLLGGLGVIFAYLSKGFGTKFTGSAKTGICFSSFGLAIGIFLLATMALSIIANPDLILDQARGLDSRVLEIYGTSSEELLGTSYEEMIANFFGWGGR